MKPFLLLSTHSGVGKNFLLTGIIRLLCRNGIKVAPFKGCSVENHSYVLADGRRMAFSQALQCIASGSPPAPIHNPVLAVFHEANCQLYVRGCPETNADLFLAHQYQRVIAESIKELTEQCELLCIEGGGSPAEIGLEDIDLPNIAVARLTKPRIVIATEMYLGGGFAHLIGTLSLLPADLRHLVAGFILNKTWLSGDQRYFARGVARLEELTSLPVLAIVPLARATVAPNEQLFEDVHSLQSNDFSRRIDHHADWLAQHIEIDRLLAG